jgi:hypothetical protein
MQIQEKTPDAPTRTNGIGKFGTFNLDHWRRLVEDNGDGGLPTVSLVSTGERIAAALERLIEKLGDTAVVEEPVPLVPSIAGDRLYTAKEAAKLMGFNVQTIRRHLRRGRYGIKDESKRLWVRQSEIDHFLLARKKVHGK